MAFQDNVSQPSGVRAPFSFAKAYAAVARVVTRMQVAQMKSVLSAMSDDELAKIELKRSDIAKHAETLALGQAVDPRDKA